LELKSASYDQNTKTTQIWTALDNLRTWLNLN